MSLPTFSFYIFPSELLPVLRRACLFRTWEKIAQQARRDRTVRCTGAAGYTALVKVKEEKGLQSRDAGTDGGGNLLKPCREVK